MGKQMEYTGTGLEVVLPDTGQVLHLTKGDTVDFAAYGGEQFFDGRTDFKVKKAVSRKGGSSG